MISGDESTVVASAATVVVFDDDFVGGMQTCLCSV